MRKFYGFYDNGTYKVGCNGATVYIYNQNNLELAKFKDIKYAYRGAFKPNSHIFVVKSTEGKLAVYDLNTLTLLRKITITTIGAQDSGFAFSVDGDLFYNIEAPHASTETCLTVYETVGFTPIGTYLGDDPHIVLEHIETYPDSVYLLGFFRDDQTGVFADGFTAKFTDGKMIEIRKIKTTAYAEKNAPQRWRATDSDYLRRFKQWESHGFAEKWLEWHDGISADTPKVTIKQIHEANA